MKIGNHHFRSIWEDGEVVKIIDQTLLPHTFEIHELASWEDAEEAIRVMRVRGAPLIGATAAWGLALAASRAPGERELRRAANGLLEARPTAVNLRWAIDRVLPELLETPEKDRATAARCLAMAICDEDVRINEAIGKHGLEILNKLHEEIGEERPLHILTHCNAGWLATVDYGTALSPIFQAHDAGIPIHVWVDETRPRNQGAHLTAWELGSHGIDHHVIVDNAGGHLMQQGLVDVCITGTDRVARNGDVCNKIGTYLKALAAADNDIPFYVALPSPTIDIDTPDGSSIPIEERSPEEVTHLRGAAEDGTVSSVRITPAGSGARNYGFDVTPARLVTALITEKGVIPAEESALREVVS